METNLPNVRIKQEKIEAESETSEYETNQDSLINDLNRPAIKIKIKKEYYQQQLDNYDTEMDSKDMAKEARKKRKQKKIKNNAHLVSNELESKIDIKPIFSTLQVSYEQSNLKIEPSSETEPEFENNEIEIAQENFLNQELTPEIFIKEEYNNQQEIDESEMVINPIFSTLQVNFAEGAPSEQTSFNIDKLAMDDKLVKELQEKILRDKPRSRNRQFNKISGLGLDKMNKANRLKKYRCKICGTIKIGQLSIKKHMNTHFSCKLWSCLICFKSFQTKPYLKKHLLQHDIKSFQCSKCSRKFKTKNTLATHEKTHDGPKLQCEVCLKMFRSKVCFRQHMRVHSGQHESFKCKYCEKTFLSLSSLNDHIKRHSEFRPFSCSFYNCNKSFYSNSDLRKHTRVHILDRNVPCTMCTRKFYSEQQLQAHMKTHSDNKRFTCEICQKMFDFASQYNQHMRQHTGERPYPCPKCDSRFLTSSHLYRHIRTHKEDQGPVELVCNECGREFKKPWFLDQHKASAHAPCNIKCEHCPEKFSSESRLQTHFGRFHQEFNCERCGRTFQGRNSYNSHLRSAHSDKPLKCAKCDERFYNKADLEVHTVTKHSEELQFFCRYENCNRAFKSQEMLDKHHTSHASPVEGNFNCEMCPKSFKYIKDYQQHLDRHMGIKPYKCEHCEKTFNTRPKQFEHVKEAHPDIEFVSCEFCDEKFVLQNQLTYHVKAKHKDLIANPRYCKLCDRNFSTPDKLRRHLRTHTDERPNVCEFCNTAFKSKYEMMRHIKTRHTNERPFTCHFDQCEKAFISNSDLTVHLKTHNPERNYKCDICEKTFMTKGVLNKHIKTHDDSKPWPCTVCEKTFKYRWLLARHLETHNETSVKEPTSQSCTNVSDDGVLNLSNTSQQIPHMLHPFINLNNLIKE